MVLEKQQWLTRPDKRKNEIVRDIRDEGHLELTSKLSTLKGES